MKPEVKKAEPEPVKDQKPREEPAKNETAKAEPDKWPDKIGPFVLESADKKSSIRFGLALQLLFRADSIDNGGKQEVSKNDPKIKPVVDKGRDDNQYIEVRRIRPSISGSLLDKKLTYYLHMSLAPRSVEVMDAWVGYEFHPYARLRVGQYKIPFTRYRIESFKDLTFPDWAITTAYFGGERQMGVSLHDGYEDPKEFQYEFGLFAGPMSRVSHTNALPKLYGEPLQNPSDLVNPGPRQSVHPEMVAHFAYNYNNINVRTDTDWEGGGFRCAPGISFAYDFIPQYGVDLFSRAAPEFLMKYEGFSLSALYYMGWAEKSGKKMSFGASDMMGPLLQASYLIAKRVEISGRWALVLTGKDVQRDADARGKAIVKAATEKYAKKYPVTEDPNDEATAIEWSLVKSVDDMATLMNNQNTLAALKKQYKKAGDQSAEQEATFGINVYIIGNSLKWQNDASWLERKFIIHSENGRKAKLTDYRFRSQIQLAF